MTERRFDRLWPILVGLAVALTGTIGLELYAERGDTTGKVIVITSSAPPGIGEDVDEGDVGASEAASAPLDAAHAQARLLARRGLLDDALLAFRAVVASHPGDAGVHAELGFWQLARGDAKGALIELEQAASLNPREPWIALNLGVAAARTGDERRAEAQYRQALVLRPTFGAAELALGSLLGRTGRVDEAIEVLTRAAEAGSNDDRARALVALGRAHLTAKHDAEASAAMDRAIEFAPAAVEIRIGIARAWLATGRRADTSHAIDVLRRAADLAPDVAAVYSALGRALEKSNDDAGAEAAYQRAVRLDPDYRYARRRLLRLALDRQDFPQARAAADDLLARAPEDPEHHLLAALVAARDGRPDDARVHYQAAITRADGTYPEAYFNLAIVEKNSGHRDAAIAAYRKAIEQRPAYPQAWNNLGLLLAVDAPVDAEQAFRRAIEIDPSYAAGWLNLGEFLVDQKREVEAIDTLKQAMTLREHYPEARLNLMLALRAAGRADEARTTGADMVAAEPRYVPGWFQYGVLLADAGDGPAAIAAWRAALAIDPDYLRARRKLAAAIADGSDVAAAIAAWRDVLDRAPDDVEARLGLATAQAARNDLAGCAVTLRGLPAATALPPALATRAAALRARCPNP